MIFFYRNSVNAIEAVAELRTPFIRQKGIKRTLLHYLCIEGCADELLALLIGIGIPIHDGDREQNTALHYASLSGRLSLCKLLVSRGADVDAKNCSGKTPLNMAVYGDKYDIVVWLLSQQEPSCLKWDGLIFRKLMEKQPEAAIMYLDKFAFERGAATYGSVNVEYVDLNLMYGEPDVAIDATPLALAVAKANTKNVLVHRSMRYIMDIKWKLVRYIFLRELYAYLGLLLSYYATIIFGSPNWISLSSPSDYGVMVLRTVAWLCCLYLVVMVELFEFRGGNYFNSYWNWLNMISYGAILASVPLEFIGGPFSPASYGLLALITVSLWLNLLQYLCIHKRTGLLIATMGRMIHDVCQFIVLYSIFLMGFSSALYLILRGCVGYENYVNAMITVLLMLFGNITYDPYKNATGWKWAFSNLLLLVYLVCVVVMLLNVLIAMLSTSYDLITEAAEEQYWLNKAETILRIERTIHPTVLKRQYALLNAPNVDDKKSTNNSTLSADAEDDIEAKGDIEQQAQKQQFPPMGDIPQKYYIDNPPAKAARQFDNSLYCLEDGVRVEECRNKKGALSPEMEARFDRIETSVTEEMEMRLGSMQVNKDMATQIRVLTATILELQKHCVWKHPRGWSQWTRAQTLVRSEGGY